MPVFVSGAFQDEQTGGQWPAIIGALAHDPEVWATITNGTHIDSLGPGAITRWLEFLDLYVADRVPTPSPTLVALAPLHLPAGGRRALGPGGTGGLHRRAEPDRGPGRLRTTAPGAGPVRQRWGERGRRGHAAGLEPGLHGLAPARRRRHHLPVGCWRLPHHQADLAGHRLLPARPVGADRPTTSLPEAPGPPCPPYQWVPAEGADGVGFVSAPLTQRRGGDRPGQPRPVGREHRRRHRPPGHHLRGAAGREGAVRADRGAPGQRPGPRSLGVDTHRSRAHLRRRHRLPAAERPLHRGADTHRTVRLRLPGRIQDPGLGHRARAATVRSGSSTPTPPAAR